MAQDFFQGILDVGRIAQVGQEQDGSGQRPHSVKMGQEALPHFPQPLRQWRRHGGGTQPGDEGF